jgi:hypothetical protein
MGFGSVFSSVWKGASDKAKAAVAVIAKTSTESINKIQEGYQKAKQELVEQARQLKENLVQTKNQAVAAIKETGVKARKFAAEKVKQIYEAGKKIASNTKDFIVSTCANTLQKVKGITDGFYNNNIDKSWDGKLLSCDNCGTQIKCENNYAVEAPNPLKKSVNAKRPPGCESSFKLEKVYYINGIITDPYTNCKTSKKMSQELCVEVISVYNRTQGFGADVVECMKNMRRISDLPATDSMVDLMKQHFSPPNRPPYEQLNLTAHSQGGLICQQALIEYKNFLKTQRLPPNEIDEIMQSINVKSFGTATNGWPAGPNYEQYTNIFDPIPITIAAAQVLFFEKTNNSGDIAKIPQKNIHNFPSPHINPIDSHSMDDVYIEKLKETEKLKKKDRKYCSNCKNKPT